METQDSNEAHAYHVFSESGWALLKRKSVRFSQKQKKFLYDLFIRGEVIGRKISPEKAVKELCTATAKECEKMFTPQEYLTKSQIQSLFSRMSAIQKSGQLQASAVNEIEDRIDENDLIDENSVTETVHEIRRIIEDIQNEQKIPVQIGNYVAAVHRDSREWYIGDVEINDEQIRVNYMKPSGSKGKNFQWPKTADDQDWVHQSDIMKCLEPPAIQGTTNRLSFVFIEDQISECHNLFKEWILENKN